MLKIEGLFVKYNNLGIINGVSMEVFSKETVALVGANGAGKTALVRAISKLNPIYKGKMYFNGVDITDYAADKIVDAGIIQVPEGRKLFSQMSVRENLRMGAYNRRARAREKENLEYVYSLFPDLKLYAGVPCGNLSGGQQQMVAIGRGIMACPKLLILDEPSIGLSPISTQAMFAAIRHINETGIAVLLTEQNVAEALAIAARAYVIEQGRIGLAGGASAIARDPKLKEIYLGM